MSSVIFLQLALSGLLFNNVGAIQQQPDITVKLETRGTVFEAQSQCYDPLLKSDGGDGGDGKLSRDEYSFFIEQYVNNTESGNHSLDNLSEYHGLIISNFNGTIDAYSQVFDASFLSMRQFCSSLDICSEEGTSVDGINESLPIFKEDIESGAVDTMSEQLKKMYLHKLCEDTIENINEIYSSFGREENFGISLEYEFHTYVIDKSDVERRLSIEWDRFLHETDVGHFVGYILTSVEVIGDCPGDHTSDSLLLDTTENKEHNCYIVRLSSTASTNKANLSPNDQVAAQVTNELQNIIENDTFGYGCQDDEGCLIVLMLPTKKEVEIKQNLSPLYISLGGVAAVGLLVAIPFIIRRRGGTTVGGNKDLNNDVDIEFPISVPIEDEDIMCDESASLSDSTSSYIEIATIEFA